MEKEIIVINSKGLHARPATIFARCAGEHPESVFVSYGTKTVNGKSLIALMSLAVPANGQVHVKIEGNGGDLVMDRLSAILARNYDQ